MKASVKTDVKTRGVELEAVIKISSRWLIEIKQILKEIMKILYSYVILKVLAFPMEHLSNTSGKISV